METKGGGWTVIQRRNQGPRENFYRTWQDYEKGFGSPYNQYWAGKSAAFRLSDKARLYHVTQSA